MATPTTWSALRAVVHREARIRVTNAAFIFWDVFYPLAYMLVFGVGMDAALGAPATSPGVDYNAFFLGGVLGMASFGIASNTAWSFFMDRDNGIFYEMLTYPLSRSQYLLGKVLFNVGVALVQGAIAQDLKWKPEMLEDTMALYAGLTRQSLDADVIVWPEAAVPTLIEYVRPFLDGVRRTAAARGSTVLLGILHREPGAPLENAQNVLISLTEPEQMYVKRHLVPFGEYFPVPRFVRSWLRLMNLPYNDILPATQDQPEIAFGGERAAITICYEDVFGAEQLQFLPDATLLVNVSNDAWFGDSIAPHQHLQIARVRAAEAGRWLLRSTNTGVTAVIDPRGRVAQQLPQFEPGVLKHTVQGYTGSTPYARTGNWLVLVAAFAAALSQLPLLAKLVHRHRH
jgi:apolipoprotein N-acyltransferase